MRKIVGMVLCLSLILGCCGSVFAANYDGDEAADYAQEWALSRNSKYYSYSSDCANFASQSLKAGGLPTDSNWKGAKKRGDNTRAWINCEAQKLYLANMERGSQVKSYKKAANAPETSGYVSDGRLVYYDWQDNGSIDHVAVGTMKDSYGRKYVSAHTTDRLNAIWTLKPLSLIHI